MFTDGEHHGDHAAPLRAACERRDDAVVVHVSGEVDSTTAPVLREQLTAAFADAAADRVPVVVDLTEVRFFASIGLSLLVEHHQLGARQGTPLRVVAPAGNMLRALRATTLDRVLELYAELPEALAAR